MTSNAQMRLQTARLEAKLTRVAMGAVIAHPSAESWARVNCEDNFALVMLSTAESAIFDTFTGNMTEVETQWVNMACEKRASQSYLTAFCLIVCRQAYNTLRQPLTKRRASATICAL
jgi:hypothetical protein